MGSRLCLNSYERCCLLIPLTSLTTPALTYVFIRIYCFHSQTTSTRRIAPR
jgi:hypothetical protein